MTGLGGTQRQILQALPEGVALTRSEIAAAVHCRPNDVTGSLGRLGQRGLITCCDDLWCSTDLGDMAVGR